MVGSVAGGRNAGPPDRVINPPIEQPSFERSPNSFGTLKMSLPLWDLSNIER